MPRPRAGSAVRRAVGARGTRDSQCRCPSRWSLVVQSSHGGGSPFWRGYARPPTGSAQPGSDQPPGAARASGGRNSKARANSPASQRGGVRGPALSSAIPFVYHRRGTVGAGSSARSKRRLLGWRQGAGEVSGDSEKPRRIADGRAPHVLRARPRRRAEPRVACGDGVRRWLARRVLSIASPAAVGWGRACTGARRYRRLISMDGWTTHLNREFVIGGPRGIVRSHAYWMVCRIWM